MAKAERARSATAQGDSDPVLHGVSFDDVAEYSGILPDLAVFETARDPVAVIAEKIAAVVIGTPRLNSIEGWVALGGQLWEARLRSLALPWSPMS